MCLLRSKIILYAVAMAMTLLFIPSQVLAGDKKSPEEIILSKADIDTSYKILKLETLKDLGTAKEVAKENEEELRKITSKLEGDAAIFIRHWPDPAKVDVHNTDAIIIKYLNAKEIEKRSKKAKEPPVLKKEHPLDPEPVLIENEDVDFPYSILGVLNLRPTFLASNSAQAMDNLLREEASKYYNADGVIFVEYLRSGSDVLGALGIMIKFMESWDMPKVNPTVAPTKDAAKEAEAKPEGETEKEIKKESEKE